MQGNPGRPKGARHKTTLAIETILEGEAEALTRKAVELAKTGDTTALRLCLERLAPPRKDRPVHVTLPPLERIEDTKAATAAVLQAVATGDLTPSEGETVAKLIETHRRAVELVDLKRASRGWSNRKGCVHDPRSRAPGSGGSSRREAPRTTTSWPPQFLFSSPHELHAHSVGR